MKKVVFCTPSLSGPTKPYIAALEASLPLVEAAGYEHKYVEQIGFPYISAARANMMRAALDWNADVIVFIDYDMSWDAADLVKLIETEGDVVAGTYRAKIDEVQYMGTIETNADHTPVVRASDGAISAKLVPAGFLKITCGAVDLFMSKYPELVYGPHYHASVDLFNHGVHERIWWGEDYSFSRRWKEKCGPIWIVPNINLDHNGVTRSRDGEIAGSKVYKGNFHEYLMRQPGGSNAPVQAP